ncbi:FAD-dependent pyridine nucleotide-disulphide oxidoreductase [Janibacter sp. HTCC2649]|uniref:FAD-dependent oxidoreductase n=1 Tax=Janibacter sp. HTCC2649 TaxID=313589 RepID=UPI0000670876|nr:FAD-dependent oxidoreductase [Janibacter sp. HTCC2649]EAP99757.1 FAD-dependent pyridine nucleotide-disulphide oxidoreductase [Janibacter sp. HTCC2649]
MRLVVIGNGMVGSRFVEDLLRRDTGGKYDVTVLGAEGCEPYNRVLLSEVVAGRYDLTSLTLPTPDHPRLTVLRGTTAAAIDRHDRVVTTTDGSRHRYDQLVLATGAEARIPPLAGLDNGTGTLPLGVHALRSTDDAREIIAATLNSRRAVVLGAGVLGIEAASGLAQRGCAVTIVHPAAALMERQLDTSASSVLASAMPELGIHPRIGVGAEAAVVANGRLTGIRLTDGDVVESDLLLVATGTITNTAIAAEAGIPCERGILVDDTASTADARIFAIGDCAQPPSGAMGLVAQGWDQARALADRLTGTTVRRRGADTTSSDVVRVKAYGLDVVTMGVCGGSRADDPAQRTLSLSDPDAGRHVEVVVSGDRLVGATCVGAGQVAADLVAAYTRRTPVPSDPARLLLTALSAAPVVATTPDALPEDAAVCRCNSVTKADIREAHACGARSVDEIATATRATTGCGGCKDEVCGLLGWLTEQTPATAVR